MFSQKQKKKYHSKTQLDQKNLPFHNVLNQRLWRMCFPVNFAKFLRTPFLQNTSRLMLLQSFGTLQTSVL